MTAQTPSRSPAPVQQHETPNVEDEIRRRAYELYEQRGKEDGHEVEDWLRAEQEIKQTRSRGVAA